MSDLGLGGYVVVLVSNSYTFYYYKLFIDKAMFNENVFIFFYSSSFFIFIYSMYYNALSGLSAYK